MIGQVLEGVNQAAAHSILAGEQEREENHSHLTVTEFPAAFPFGVLDRLEPSVKHAGDFTAICHVDLAVGSTLNEPLEGDLTGLDGPVDLGSRNGEGEVDEFEGTGDIPVLVTDLPGGDRGDVISTEDTQRGVHVEVTGGHHDGMSLPIGVDPITEVLAGDLVLDVKVKAVWGMSGKATSRK